MRKLNILIVLLTVCVTVMAQSKWTPQGLMRLGKEKKNIEFRASKAKGLDMKSGSEEARVNLVVKVSDHDAVQTYARLRAVGAEVLSRLGDQAVISLPVDSAEAVARIEGVTRIDAGHKPQWKTDVTRRETGVTMIDGSQPSDIVPLTGKGVTVCLIDVGFDFQHPAFKDSEGRSRIKAVYMPFNSGGNKFTVDDPVAGAYTFPGSIYDTPELIATLTTDTDEEAHGTHTAGIAAGSISPMGFGGMAPEADLVLVPIPYYDDEGNEVNESVVELALSFATCYAEAHNLPMVVSMSANSHDGPHDGTGCVPEAIQQASAKVIPVFAVGNEGDSPIHVFKHFTGGEDSVKVMLASDGIMGMGDFTGGAVGYTRNSGELSVKVSLYNRMTKKTLWQSQTFTATPGSDMEMVEFGDDEELANRFDGSLLVAFGSSNGKQAFAVTAIGKVKTKAYFAITVTGTDGTEVDLWDQTYGFEEYGSDGFTKGDSEISGGDWTSIPGVVSVGAYCANRTERTYSSTTTYAVAEGSYLDFSSYGTMLNGLTQPTVSAPGVFVVSSWNHYCIGENEKLLDNMLWQGYPYSAESGTSMSCPVVSGIVALWLQANPDLTIDEVKKVLQESSRNDEYTMASSQRAGFGKVDAAKGLEYILASGIRDINNHVTSKEDVLYDLQGRRISGSSIHKGIYIRGGRKYIKR